MKTLNKICEKHISDGMKNFFRLTGDKRIKRSELAYIKKFAEQMARDITDESTELLISMLSDKVLVDMVNNKLDSDE